MTSPNNYRRPPLHHRPWITGGLYDNLAGVLHCDAFMVLYRPLAADVLVLDWHKGGRKLIARDAYLIEPDGLTPLWDTSKVLLDGIPQYWTPANHKLMARVHRTVVERCDELPQVVSLLAHYVRLTERDGEIAANKYVERGANKT